MATPTQTEEIELVGREGHNNNVFNYEGIQRLISSCDAPNDPYTIVSIIGPQSGGKSTLMNGIFNTKFTVMDESIEWRRTTKGIWASICNDAQAIVLDVEGTDSVDNQNDLGFETRTALFALVISDVIFVNMSMQQVNLTHGNCLLKKIFEEVEKRAGPQGLPEQYQTKIVFAVRNYNGMTPERKLKETIISNVHEIWKTIPQEENSKLENYFKLHVELFPDLHYEKTKFYNKCKQLRKCIVHGDWVHPNVTHLPVSTFPSFAKELWETILENRTLDLPSHMEMMALTTCESIMLDKFQYFCSIEYKKLTDHHYDDPKQFDDNLKQILDDTISDYNKETHLYGKYADEKMTDLKTKIVHHAEEEFRIVMIRYQNSIIEKAETAIRLKREQRIIEMRNWANYVVSKYFSEFESKINDLTFYSYQIDYSNFWQTLDSHGIKLIDNAVRTSRETCSAVKSKIFSKFIDNKFQEYQLYDCEKDNPMSFENGLKRILKMINYEYTENTEDCAQDIADEMKQELEKAVLNHSEEEFVIVTKSFQKRIASDVEEAIILACGNQTSGLEEHKKSVVKKYKFKFLSLTEGLDYYKKSVDTDIFLHLLELFGEKVAHYTKKKNIKDHILRVTVGVLLAVATAATNLAGTSFALGPAGFVIVGSISAAVAAISAGAASIFGVKLAQSEKANRRPVPEAWHVFGEKYFSKVEETASSAGDLSDPDHSGPVPEASDVVGEKYFSKLEETASGTAELSDPYRNAVEAAHKEATEIIRNILKTKAPGDRRAEKILAIMMGPEASGIQFGTERDNASYVDLILKGLSEDLPDEKR